MRGILAAGIVASSVIPLWLAYSAWKNAMHGRVDVQALMLIAVALLVVGTCANRAARTRAIWVSLLSIAVAGALYEIMIVTGTLLPLKLPPVRSVYFVLGRGGRVALLVAIAAVLSYGLRLLFDAAGGATAGDTGQPSPGSSEAPAHADERRYGTPRRFDARTIASICLTASAFFPVLAAYRDLGRGLAIPIGLLLLAAIQLVLGVRLSRAIRPRVIWIPAAAIVTSMVLWDVAGAAPSLLGAAPLGGWGAYLLGRGCRLCLAVALVGVAWVVCVVSEERVQCHG